MKYDMRAFIWNRFTGETFYCAEMIEDEIRKYELPERNKQAFAICRDLMFNIEKYKALACIEENL